MNEAEFTSGRRDLSAFPHTNNRIQMNTKLTLLAVSAAAALAANGQETWRSIDGIIPNLTSSSTVTRINRGDGGSGLIGEGAPSAENVQTALGSLGAGWYSGTKNNDSGTIAFIPRDHTITIVSPVGAGGGFAAAKFNELTADSLSGFDALKFSFDVGSLSDTGSVGQKQNFSLWYSLGADESTPLQVGETISGTAGNLTGTTASWTMNKADYSNLFSQGGQFYLVLNTNGLISTQAYQTIELSNFKLEGLVVPEPSSAAVMLLGIGMVSCVRRRRRDGNKALNQ